LFRDRHADVDLRISARQSLVDRARGENDQGSHLLDGGDIAIRFGDGDYPGYVTHKLFTSYSLPMCSPRLLEGPNALRTPDDLRNHTLLHFESDIAMMDVGRPNWTSRSEEHTSELESLMRISYAVFCLKKKK